MKRRDAKFCSAICRAAAHRAGGYVHPPKPPKPPREAVCIICSAAFSQSGRGRTRATCGPECATAKQQADSRAFHERRKADGRQAAINDDRRKHEPRPCRDCGQMLHVGYRCRVCSKAWQRVLSKVPGTGPLRLAIFERDSWTCQICGDGIDPELTFPDPMSPSIDHIVPLRDCLEQFGSDYVDNESNWQAAHVRCNTAKGVRLIA